MDGDLYRRVECHTITIAMRMRLRNGVMRANVRALTLVHSILAVNVSFI
jgi:hypothetical protein